MEKRRYDAVDVAKWICAWFVMYIHLAPVLTGLPTLDKITREGICRVAVPFFFAASSFLLFGKMGDPVRCARENRRALWGFCRRILTMYTVWALIYIAYKAVYRQYNGQPPEGDLLYYIQGFFFRGVQIHLWYLMATVYAAPVVYLLWKAGRKALIAVCAVGNILLCLENPYKILPVTEPGFVDFLRNDLGLLFCTVLHSIPKMCLGVLCLSDYGKRTGKQWFFRFAAWSIPYMLEAIGLYLYTNGSFDAGGSVFLLPMIYCMVNWLFAADFRLPKKWMGKALRLSSTWIYCAHWLVMCLWHWVFAYEGLLRFAAVGCLTAASSIPYVLWKLRPKKQLAGASEKR